MNKLQQFTRENKSFLKYRALDTDSEVWGEKNKLSKAVEGIIIFNLNPAVLLSNTILPFIDSIRLIILNKPMPFFNFNVLFKSNPIPSSL